MPDLTGLPDRLDFTGRDAIPQGMDWNSYHAFEYVDGDGDLVAADYTGYTARMMIRADYDSAVILELTTGNGRIQVGSGGVGGWSLSLHLSAAATARDGTNGAAINSFGIGVYDCEVISTFGVVTRVLHGRVAFSREVTG